LSDGTIALKSCQSALEWLCLYTKAFVPDLPVPSPCSLKEAMHVSSHLLPVNWLNLSLTLDYFGRNAATAVTQNHNSF